MGWLILTSKSGRHNFNKRTKLSGYSLRWSFSFLLNTQLHENFSSKYKTKLSGYSLRWSFSFLLNTQLHVYFSSKYKTQRRESIYQESFISVCAPQKGKGCSLLFSKRKILCIGFIAFLIMEKVFHCICQK